MSATGRVSAAVLQVAGYRRGRDGEDRVGRDRRPAEPGAINAVSAPVGASGSVYGGGVFRTARGASDPDLLTSLNNNSRETGSNFKQQI